MSGLLLCGKQAKDPLYIESAELHIYSIEELGYYLYNNIFMIGREFFNESLIHFLSEQLNMKSLAGRVKYLIDHRGTFPELIMLVVKSASYYSEEELEELEETLKLIGTKSVTERLKVRGDIYMQSGKINQAMKVYREILTIPKNKDLSDDFYGKVYYNIGTVFARKMEYREALEYYRKAYELYPAQEILLGIVKVDLMWENEQELIHDTMNYEITDELLDKAGEVIEKCREEAMESEKYEELCNLLIYNGKHNLDDYYENIQNLFDAWKNEYREEMV